MKKEWHMLRGSWLLDVLVAMRANPQYWDVLSVKPTHMQGGGMGRFDPHAGVYDTMAGESPGQQLPRIKEIRIPGEGDYPGEWLILNPAWQTMMQDKLEAEGCMHEFRAFERNGRSEVAYTVNGRVVWGFHPRPLLQAALLASSCTPPMMPLEV